MDIDEKVEWDVAIEEGGFYFERARYLGLPMPPACFVYTDLEDDPGAIEVIAAYHDLFIQADIEKVDNIMQLSGPLS